MAWWSSASISGVFCCRRLPWSELGRGSASWKKRAARPGFLPTPGVIPKRNASRSPTRSSPKPNSKRINRRPGVERRSALGASNGRRIQRGYIRYRNKRTRTGCCPCGSFSLSLRSAKQKGCGSRSLELDVIARIHGPPGVGQKHGRGIMADAEHDPFAKNFARQIGPGIADGAAPEPVHFVFKSNGLIDVVRMSSLISECTDIIAHLGGLRTSQLHIDDLACPSFNEEVLRRYYHADWPAAHGRKDIEGGVLFQRWRRALLKRACNVTAPHEVAGKDHLGNRSLGENVHDAHTARILVLHPHCMAQFRQIPVPGHPHFVLDGADDCVLIAFFHTLRRA